MTSLPRLNDCWLYPVPSSIEDGNYLNFSVQTWEETKLQILKFLSAQAFKRSMN